MTDDSLGCSVDNPQVKLSLQRACGVSMVSSGSQCDHQPRHLALIDRNHTLFVSCRPAIAEKQVKWREWTKLDELVLH
jgi:hypothetical protein